MDEHSHGTQSQGDSGRGQSVSVDPRMLRQLPWVFRMDDVRRLFVARNGISMLTLFLPPLLVAIVATVVVIRRRSRNKTTKAVLLIALISICAVTCFGCFLASRSSTGPPWIMAIILVPPFAFFAKIAWQIVQKKWKSNVKWLVVAASISVGLSILVLFYHGVTPELSLQPGEQYSWNGWYLIVVWGIYVTGLLILADVVIQALRSGIRRVPRPIR